MTPLQHANQALREQRYAAALDLYRQVLAQAPGLHGAVRPSVLILQRRWQASGQPLPAASQAQLAALIDAPPSPASRWQPSSP